MLATCSPLIISAAPGSVLPITSTTLPFSSVESTSSSISRSLPCTTRINLNGSLTSLVLPSASIARFQPRDLHALIRNFLVHHHVVERRRGADLKIIGLRSRYRIPSEVHRI